MLVLAREIVNKLFGEKGLFLLRARLFDPIKVIFSNSICNLLQNHQAVSWEKDVHRFARTTFMFIFQTINPSICKLGIL